MARRGVKQVLGNFRKLEQLVINEVAQAAREAVGEELLKQADKEVPLDTGHLQSTHFVEHVDRKNTIAGYDTDYAAKLHYHPEYDFQNGRKAFYLTDPAIAMDPTKTALPEVKNTLKKYKPTSL